MSSPVVALPGGVATEWWETARRAGLAPAELGQEPAAPETLLDAGTLPPAELGRVAAGLPSLRWIHVLRPSVHGIDLAALEARGVVVTDSRGCRDIPIGEHVMAALLACATRERRGLARSCLGLLGFGGAAQEVARLAKAFRMRVVAAKRLKGAKRHSNVDRLHGGADLGRVLKAADHLVVTLPLTPQTRGILGAEELALLRPGTCLACISPRGVLCEDALLEGLGKGRPAEICLDALASDGMPADHPLRSQARAIVTAHAAGEGPHVEGRLLDLFGRNCERWLRFRDERPARKLINVVDAEAGY